MNITAERLKYAMELRGVSQAELCKKTDICKSSVSTYLKGSYEPKQHNIYKMAQVLRVSPDWLAGRDVPIDSAPNLDDAALKFALFNSSEGITDEMLQEVREFAKYVLAKNS